MRKNLKYLKVKETISILVLLFFTQLNAKVHFVQDINDCSDISISSSSEQVCAGESVELRVENNIPTICDMQIELTDIPFGEEIPGFTYGGFFNDHHYYVYNTPTSWTNGEQICRENGGYLVCINDESENAFVSNLTDNNIWIGLFRDPETCEFRWLDCININYTNWRPGEPNNGPCGEPYTQIIRGCSYGYNTWNNLSDNSSNGACYSNMVPIMEIDPKIYSSFDPNIKYTWSTGDTTEVISVTPSETTEYWVDVTSKGVTCRNYITINATTPAAPIGDPVQTFCEASLVADLNAEGSNIKWYDAYAAGNVLELNTALTDGQIVYASQTVDGCESSNRLEVSVDLNIVPDPILISTDLEFCMSQKATLEDLEIYTQGYSLKWYNSSNDGNILSLDTLLEDSVSYFAILYDNISGCESHMRLEIVPTVVPCEVIIYNAISPNADGQNDIFTIQNIESHPDNELTVFNRWGKILYQTKAYGSYNRYFRGRAQNGEVLPVGVYYYILKINEESNSKTYKGYLYINR